MTQKHQQSPWILGTGFTRGIGYEIAHTFKHHGFKIAHIGRQPWGPEDAFFECDLATSPKNLCAALKSLPEFLTTHHVCGFIYAAGFMPQLQTYGPGCLDSLSTSESFCTSQEQSLQVNYLSYACLSQIVLPLLQSLPSNAQPFVAHLNSLAAVDPFVGLELYGTAKACVLAHTKWLASCVPAARAHVLAIHPGTVKTDMVSQGILGSNPPAALRELFETLKKTGGFTDAHKVAQSIVDFLLGENALKDQAHGKLYLADCGKVALTV